MAISTPYVAGPSNWYVNAGSGAAWLHLGMCESDTQLNISPEWDGIQIDGGGFRCDYDRQFMGAMASVSGDLIFYKEPVLNALRNFLNDSSATPGQWANGTIGTLARTEGRAFGLVITSQYADKPAFSNNGMNALWYFPFVCMMPGGENLGTRTKRVRTAFDCIPVLNGLGGGVLYYNSISFTLPTPT